MRKKIWLRRLKDPDKLEFPGFEQHKYALYADDLPAQMMLLDGSFVTCFEILEFYKNDDGQYVPIQSVRTYITVEALMQQFVIEDSRVHDRIKWAETVIEDNLRLNAKDSNERLVKLLDLLYKTDPNKPSEDATYLDNPVGEYDEIERRINDC